MYMLGITGHCPKRLGSLDGLVTSVEVCLSYFYDIRLTDSQKVTRAEWFIMELKDRLDCSAGT